MSGTQKSGKIKVDLKERGESLWHRNDDPNLTAAREEAAIKAAAMLEDINGQRIINQLHAVDSSWARILEGAQKQH